jgi:cell division initiation protein
MITPLEIQNKQFSKKIRGYDENEVDEFLDRLTEDYEGIYRENANLKDRINILEDKLKHYTGMETSLQNALVLAQSTADEAAKNAHEKGELIIKQAEEEARRIIERANEKIMHIEEQYQEAKRQMYIFRTRFKTLLEAQLETVVTLCGQLEDEE